MECLKSKIYWPSDLNSANEDQSNASLTKNILKIPYSILIQDKQYLTKPAITCKTCSAILSPYSTVLNAEEYNNKFPDRVKKPKTNKPTTKVPSKVATVTKPTTKTPAKVVTKEPTKSSTTKVASKDSPNKGATKDSASKLVSKASPTKAASTSNASPAKKSEDKPEVIVPKEPSVWICEFCGTHKTLEIDTILPEGSDVLYMTKKGKPFVEPVEESKGEDSNIAGDTESKVDACLNLCIDISGSMDEKHEVKSESYPDRDSVERIKLLTDAVLKQVENMKSRHPNKKVGLVTFNNKVCIYGDCSNEGAYADDQFYQNSEELHKFGESEALTKLLKPLSESFSNLEKVIKELKPTHRTALGPGLLCSLGMVKNKPASRVILVTDGLANVGIGKLGVRNGASETVYSNIGDWAADLGLSVSIITVKGTVCRVDALGPLTDKTGGVILRVDPANMDLSDILANKLAAMKVKVRAFVSSDFYFQTHFVGTHWYGSSKIEVVAGLVNDSNEIYLEFGKKPAPVVAPVALPMKSKGKGLHNFATPIITPVIPPAPNSVPVQVHIIYTDFLGNEFTRVISVRHEVTQDEVEAEKDIRPDILIGYVQKETANLAILQRYGEAKSKNKQWTGYMKNVKGRKELKDEDKKLWEEFEVENESLCEAIEKSESLVKSEDQVMMDEVTSNLYKAKQVRRKK